MGQTFKSTPAAPVSEDSPVIPIGGEPDHLAVPVHDHDALESTAQDALETALVCLKAQNDRLDRHPQQVNGTLQAVWSCFDVAIGMVADRLKAMKG